MPRANRGGDIAPEPPMSAERPVDGAGVPAGAAEPLGPQAAPSGPPPSPVPAGALGGLASPTNRPNEPITEGLRPGAGMPPPAPTGPQTGPDPDAVLRALYSIYPHPDLERMLR